MKFLLLLLLGLTFAAAECSPTQSKTDKPKTDAKNTMKSQNGENGDLEFEVSFEKESESLLRVKYQIKNSGKSDYLLYNRGTSLQMNRGVVFVEPQSDNLVEISQKRFFEPKDKNCPDREAPIYPAASLLKSGETIKEELSVSLPLELKTPFDDCLPQPEMPKKIKKVRFCLGAAKINAISDVKSDEQGIIIIRGGEDIEAQQLLCGEAFKLN